MPVSVSSSWTASKNLPRVALSPAALSRKGWMWMTPSAWLWMPSGSDWSKIGSANPSQMKMP